MNDQYPELLKGGVIRRAFALLIDLIFAEVLIQLVAAAAFPLSGGLLVDTNSIYTSCIDTPNRPTGVELPAEFRDALVQECTKTFLGWPTARLLTLSYRNEVHATVSISYAVDRSGRTKAAFDLGQLQLLIVVLTRWGLERRGWTSLGRKCLSLRVLARGSDPAAALDRRYLTFGIFLIPALVLEVVTFIVQLSGLPVPADPFVVLTFLGNLPFTVAIFAAAAAIRRRRDAFYDLRAKTTTAQLVGGHVEVASDIPMAFASYWPGGAAAAGRRVADLRKTPWLGLTLAAILVAIFVAELLFGSYIRPGTPVNTTLIVFGGMSHELVSQIGQWSRLVTAIFLHASFAHLMANIAVLVSAAWFLEGLLGRGWFLAIFILGGLGGSAASITFNEPNMVSVGASGAITAVLAAGLVVSARLIDDERRLWLRAFCSACLLAALQARGKFAWGTVDRADHIGGAAAGAIIGAIILASWRLAASQPRWQGLALGAALAVTIGLFVSVPQAGFGDPPMTALLMPEAQWPKTDADWETRAPEMVRRFPADWRGYIGLAMAAGTNEQEREQEMTRAIAAALRFENNRAKVEQSIYMTVGVSREAARDWSAAQDLYSRVITAVPDDSNALRKRAYTEECLGLFDAALLDLNAVARLRPNEAETDVQISDVLLDLGRFDESVATLDRALAIAPNNQLAFRQRGWIAYLGMRGETSLQDLQRATTLDPKDAYAALWLDIAATRSGQPGRLEELSRSLDPSAWPAPVVKLFLGQTDVDELMRAARSAADPVQRDGQSCEASFYYGEWLAMHEANSRAQSHFEDAVTNCPKSFYEYASAKAELALEDRGQK